MLNRFLFAFVAIAIINADNCIDLQLKALIKKEIGPDVFIYPDGYLKIIKNIVSSGSNKEGIIAIKELDQVGARYKLSNEFASKLQSMTLATSQVYQWNDKISNRNENHIQQNIGAAYQDGANVRFVLIEAKVRGNLTDYGRMMLYFGLFKRRRAIYQKAIQEALLARAYEVIMAQIDKN